MELRNKKVVIIGAGQGIGFATSKLLAEKGAIVFMAARTKDKIEAAAKTVGTNAIPMPLDFTDESSVRKFFVDIGQIDHLVCAGVSNSAWGKLNEIETKALQNAFKGKFWGYFFSAKYAVNFLAKNGSITFVIAGSARKPIPGTIGLAAVNGAILTMGKTMAAELAPIRVNLVSPGIIDTPYHNWMGEEKKQTFFKQMETRIPLGRVGKPEEVAKAIISIIENDFITGAVLDVDGGGSL